MRVYGYELTNILEIYLRGTFFIDIDFCNDSKLFKC